MQIEIGIEKTEEEKINEAIEVLTNNGYIVIEPKISNKKNIKKAEDLVEYFYSLLQFYNKNRDIHYTYSRRDIKIAKELVKSRGYIGKGSKNRALSEASAIIQCVVKNEDRFGFKSPLKSFSCFGQDKMKWVTEKAISIINKEEHDMEEEEFNLYMENLYVEQENKAIENLSKKTIDELKEMLGGLSNGKKEKK